MNIVMMNNTYRPYRSEVARSIEQFVGACQKYGHHVFVVAPEFGGEPPKGADVFRMSLTPHFNGSDLSVIVPIPKALSEALDAFEPDIVHSHQPFFLGTTAMTLARARQLPIIYTNHAMYERYTDYAPSGTDRLKEHIRNLCVSYANCCDRVVVPSKAMSTTLRKRGVTAPMDVIATGVDCDAFASGDDQKVRQAHDIPLSAFVVGHAGRHVAEKDLQFLTEALARFMPNEPTVHCLVLGPGPAEKERWSALAGASVANRVHFLGCLSGQDRINAYHAMDVFAFTSPVETQAMVVAEAMAAGKPVVALRAPGMAELVRDGVNGRLIEQEDVAAFHRALIWCAELWPEKWTQLEHNAQHTAQAFSADQFTQQLLSLYEETCTAHTSQTDSDKDYAELARLGCLIGEEWRKWSTEITTDKPIGTTD